jgi:tRNA A-37 threonylcarbamoyl transferase component Bud32
MAGTGRVIAGRYRLKEPIGRGAMGTVWRGWDEILDREVAVKELRITEGLPEEERAKAYQRTHREARTAARLSHPGLVTVFDVAEEDGRPWIVMELVHAESLDQIIAKSGPLPPPKAADAGRQLLSALATAHAAGVLHRDVKPSNVMLADSGRAVLTDFGIATFEGDSRLTQTGMVMGSPGFTAPERIQGNSATPASDLWSLGATLYAAVEGHGPFDQAGGAITTMSAIINNEPPTAPAAAGLGRVIDALLRRNPADRPDASTAARMLGALGPLPDGPGGTYTPAATSYPPVLPRQPEAPPAGPAAGAAVGSGAGPAEAGSAPGAASAEPALDASAGSGTVTPEAAGSGRASGAAGAGVVAGAAGAAGAGVVAGAGEAAGSAGAGVAGVAGINGVSGGVGGASGAAGAGVAPLPGTSIDLPAQEEQTIPSLRPGAGPPTDRAPVPPPPPARPVPPLPMGPSYAPPLASQVPPMPSQVRPAPAMTGPGRRDRHTLRAVLIAAAVVIVLAAVAGVLLALRGHGHGSGNQQSGQSNTGTIGGTTARVPRTPAAAAAGTASDGPLPTGWTWYTASASSMGTSAGFKLAIPDGWQPARESSGRGYVFEAPGGATILQVDLTPHTFADMVKEAHYLSLEAPKQGKFPGYADQVIRATPVRGQTGASWGFTWQDPKVGEIRSLDLMYIAQTSGGPQSFALYMTSPASTFNSYLHDFTEEMRTFRPVS